MHKLVSLVVALTVLTSMAFSAGLASAAPASSDRLSPAAAQEVGDSVVINDIDGNEVATASIDDIIDPFEDMEQTPERGLRFLSIELTIENTGDDTLTVSTGNIGVVDDKGIIYTDVEVDRTDNLESLTNTDIEPGDSISGTLEVGFPEDGEIAQIVWLVGTGQLPTLLSNLEPVDERDPITLYTADYTEEAILSADQVVDEFDDVARGVDPQRGNKFVGVTVTIENVGEDPFATDPASIFLGTTNGIFWQSSPIERSADATDETPDLTTDPIEPGDTVTGFVGFEIPADLEIAYVMYLPDSIRLIHIYDIGSGGSSDSGDETPSADDDDKDDNGGLGPIGRKSPTPADDDTGQRTPRSSGDECVGAADWQDLTIETLGIWGGVFQGLDLQNPGSDTITQIEDGIAAIRDAADQQENSDPPPAAEELNDLIAQAYADSADALEQILDGIDANDTDAITSAAADIQAIGQSFTSGDVADVLDELKSACPEIDAL